MEKHRCKLCLKSFINGRALGGHMRSHMLNLPIHVNQVSQESVSASASYSSDEDDDDDKKEQIYGLRENPKRSVRMVNPEFIDAGSVVVQDRESETESSKNLTRRRSKRTRKTLYQHEEEEVVKVNITESVSSISDTTTEEDVAFCLMMLSRDQWKQHDEQEQEQDDESEEETGESEEYLKSTKPNRSTRGKYRCETCNRVFKSYQALGGHRASHKKMKPYSPATEAIHEPPENVGTSIPEKKTHECPVCFRIFSSGQALGGHKRSHVTGQVIATSTTKTAVTSSKKLGDSLIDLNLPAPMDDDDISQIELSAVSDAEFVKPF